MSGINIDFVFGLSVGAVTLGILWAMYETYPRAEQAPTCRCQSPQPKKENVTVTVPPTLVTMKPLQQVSLSSLSRGLDQPSKTASLSIATPVAKSTPAPRRAIKRGRPKTKNLGGRSKAKK